MTPIELVQKTQAARLQKEQDSDAIVALARTLPAVLRDAGREHSAKQLEELLFIWDAHQDELHKWLAESSEQIVDVLMRGLRGQQ